MSFTDRFSPVAAAYAAHRPTYPPALIDVLADAASGRALALDVACGTGQLSVPLARAFSAVVATDAAAAQIAAAVPGPRVVYRVAPAEASGLAPGGTYLVAVAQAAHWLDLPAFYAEVRRVARPGAAVALIAYRTPRIDDAAVDAVFRHFYGSVLGPWWPAERAHVERGYADLPFPFEAIAAPALTMDRRWRRRDLLGFVGTWSALTAMGAAGPAALAAFADALAVSWPDDGARTVTWPIALRLGRVR